MYFISKLNNIRDIISRTIHYISVKDKLYLPSFFNAFIWLIETMN
jgi:hypothetical protein